MKNIILVFFIAFMSAITADSHACSMCKVTINGRTYLGNNEDSWRMGSTVWFENGGEGKLGAVYFGYSDHFPQGGMNEAGLAYDGLTTLPKPIKNIAGKKSVTSPTEFLKAIMQSCRTVEDVYKYAIQYNRQQHFNHGELLFADPSGNYLVMESDTIILGKNPTYIIANFCPSITSEKEKLNWARYGRGHQFIQNNTTDTNGFRYTLALTDTMHECREKLGDGTMYSFVADLQNKDISLYFYHDFSRPIKFNLTSELEKGDHQVDMVSMFPANKEFTALTSFKTPRNTIWIAAFLMCAGTLFFISALYFTIDIILSAIKKRIGPFKNLKPVLVVLGFALCYYMYQLLSNAAILFSPAPYRDVSFSLLDIAAYLPYVCLLIILPMIYAATRIIKNPEWNILSKGMVMLNILACMILTGLFYYWKMF